MPSRSPDKKRLVSRPLSPNYKRRKLSADEKAVQDEGLDTTIAGQGQSPPATELDVIDKASSRSQSSSTGSEFEQAARLAIRDSIRDGKRPDSRYHPYPTGHESTAIWLKEQYGQDGDESPENKSSEEESPNRPGPSRVVSRRRSTHQSDDSCGKSSSGDSSLQSFLARIDDVHNALDQIDDEPDSLAQIEDEHASLDIETWSLSGGASSRSSNEAGAGPFRRRFSYEAECGLSFTRSACRSPSPSLPQANELPGADSKFDQDLHSALDVSKGRGHMPGPTEPTESSKNESRDVSPWSKHHPDWRHSKKVIAGVITGSMRLERTQPSYSRDSEAEGNRSSASMNVRSSSISSVDTNVAAGSTREMAEKLNEAMDTNISSVVALTPLLDGRGSRYDNAGHLRKKSDIKGDDEVSPIDPSLQAGVYHRKLSIASAAAESTLRPEEGQSHPDGDSSEPQCTLEALSKVSSVDPSLQVGAYDRKSPITSDTLELTLPPQKGEPRPTSLLTSNGGACAGKELVLGMSKPTHPNTVETRREDERDTLTSSATANWVNANLCGGPMTRSTADDGQEAPEAVGRTQPTRPIEWNEQIFDTEREQGVGERRALLDESSLQSPPHGHSVASLSEYPDACLFGACMRLPFCRRRRRSESAPASIPSEERWEDSPH
ncbi:MAG: hypothetical protein LQ339_002971 [Xanthoria mediterranea]|nr:MAG: hypothetical protein LQ339_002971 [Xanthoria mediterranea]